MEPNGWNKIFLQKMQFTEETLLFKQLMYSANSKTSAICGYTIVAFNMIKSFVRTKIHDENKI